MNCPDVQKSILLDDSGELAIGRLGELRAHLEHCAECRCFQALLEDAKDAVEAVDEPSAAAVWAVLRDARKAAPAARPRRISLWKPAFAAAAVVAMVAGLFLGLHRHDQIGLELTIADPQLMDLSDQAVCVMYSGLTYDDMAFNFLMTYDGDSDSQSNTSSGQSLQKRLQS